MRAKRRTAAARRGRALQIRGLATGFTPLTACLLTINRTACVTDSPDGDNGFIVHIDRRLPRLVTTRTADAGCLTLGPTGLIRRKTHNGHQGIGPDNHIVVIQRSERFRRGRAEGSICAISFFAGALRDQY